MNEIFRLVYEALVWLSELTGLSYKEINIVVFYGIIPLIYAALGDKILGKHLCKIAFVGAVLVVILVSQDLSKCCDSLFDASVDFLLAFGSIGLNYVMASVLICVIIPLIVLLVMVKFAFPSFFPAVFSWFRRDW